MLLEINVTEIKYGHVFGDIEFDPLLQAENATVVVNQIALQFVRPFRTGNKQAGIDVLIP